MSRSYCIHMTPDYMECPECEEEAVAYEESLKKISVFESEKYSPEQMLLSALKDDVQNAECMAIVWKHKDASGTWHTCIAGEMTAGNLMICSELLRVRAMESLQ